MVEAHFLPELARFFNNLVSAIHYGICMLPQRVITTLWKGGCGIGFWPLEAYRYCSSKGRSAFTVLQSSTEKYQTSFQDSRVAHPTHWGVPASLSRSSLRVETLNVMMSAMDGRTAKSFSFIFICFVESLEYPSVISLICLSFHSP